MKRATTIDEQIELLRSRGMVIKDEKKAREVLSDIGYFRLGFYCFPFEKSYPRKDNRSHLYREGALLSDVVDLYYFDTDLRNILLKYLFRIEVNFRTKLVYIVSGIYKDSPTWFADPSVVKRKYARDFGQKIYNTLFKRQAIIKRHHNDPKHLNDRFAPAWKTIEFMTFGMTMELFDAIQDLSVRDRIAKEYGLRSGKILSGYIETAKSLRNACSHGNTLFDFRLAQPINKGPAGRMTTEESSNLVGAVMVIRYLLSKISSHRESEMVDEIKSLLDSGHDNAVIADLRTKFRSKLQGR